MFMKFYKKLNKHKKRGFTLAETVLALAVISITSVGTLSLILASNRATISAAQKQQAQLAAMDIVSCFRVSDNYADFEDNLEFALGKQISENKIDLGNDMTASIEIDGKKITVVVKNEQKDLAKTEFIKGVALTNEETP